MEKITDFLGISNYDLTFKVEPLKGIFNVKGMLCIKNKGNRGCNKIPILLYKDLEIKDIKNENNEKINFKQQIISLADQQEFYVNYGLIDVDNILNGGEQINLYIEYEGSINGYSDLMMYVKDKIGKEFSIIRPDCLAYPIISEVSYENILKSYRNNFTYNISVDVPKNYTAACGGILKETVSKGNRNIFKYISSSPTWRFDIAISQYFLVEDKDMNLKIFVFPKDKVNAEDVIKNEIKRSFDFFSNVFGDYPKNNYFSVIETKTAYGSQAGDNYIVMEEDSFSGNNKKITQLYHEIGHAWNAKPKYKVKSTRFFDEAFASYFEALAIREFNGEKFYRNKMELYRKYFKMSVNEDKINYNTPIYDYGKFEIGENSYTKGPWVLYVLNEIVGNEKFYKIIRRFLYEFKGKEVDFKDFQEIAQKASGINLDKFFEQWIYGVESSKYLYDGIKLSIIIEKAK
ncbi:M1 family aminopeptidase [Haloimpatiens sp. FM7330]|uniref:M1 family aminopeptidase n=1 Tax=Haloimpatiens sp. FM7330 TaxID=3298610 RepID=UPI00364512CE